MARLIMYNDFLSSTADRGHILQSLDYISTREGVELNGMEEKLRGMRTVLNPVTAARQVTDKQKDLIERILKEFPDLKEDVPYEEFEKNQNMYTASRFISEAAEHLEELSLGNEIYVNYISERPGVEKNIDSVHGLFDESGSADLSAVREELKNHEGNVWRSIISLRRSDAEELDRENQDSWRNLLQHHIPSLAKGMGIPIEHFRWCAAFHNESYHPHVHLMYWSTHENEGFCSRETIQDFKSELANDIFSNEMWLYKEFKYSKRQELEENFLHISKETADIKIDQCYRESMKHIPEQITDDLMKLSAMLPDSGSRAYAFQDASVKEETDLIVAKILSNQSIQPIFQEYISSQRDLAAFYMRNDSKAMQEYIDSFAERMIHPGKKDRKVFHNLVLEQAFKIKDQRFIDMLKNESVLKEIEEKISDGNPTEEIRYPERTVKSIYRLYHFLGRDPEEALQAAECIISDEEKRIELYLEAKESGVYQMRMSDWKNLKHAFLPKMDLSEVYEKNDNTMHDCMKILNGVLNFMTNETKQNVKEAARIRNAIRYDEAMIRSARYKRESKRV